MARVQNTLIGRSSGSVGGATFSTWKGINVLKAKAEVVANPRTNPQLLQRSRMTILVALYRLIAGIVQTGFKTLAIGKSEYNAFVSTNIIDGTSIVSATEAEIDYPDLLLAKGTIGSIPITSITGTNASANVPVVWDENLAPVGSAPEDLAFAAVYNETQGVWGFPSANVARSTGTITVVMPAAVVTADVLHGYLFFKSAISENVSDSAYGTDTP